jgi:tape measure domain-containing protein|uniref:Tail tape measure n=1 Tax=Myoviridae sp. cte5Z19 TaxID=2825145 RepID=A0A8S5NVE2_9CAUD|nr:MAG TPA: tail tape measure [Myoviridae sp. cte5Z19]
MAESYSVKAILSAQDKNFSSIMKSCQGYANNLKTTLTGGLGFGAMAAIGGKAMSLVTNSVSDLSKETIETSDSMYKLQAAMRFSGYSEAEIQRIAGATGTLKTYADKTVFSLQDVMSTFGSLSANGIKDADKLTEAVGNAVAVFGGGAKEYSSVALAFSQAMAAGALHAQDWNQIINASPQLAGGLRKELIKLNPTLGNDFKGAMEKGAITADMLGQAINNIGMTDMAKEAATSVTTFEGAMGNLEASAVSGMMKLYDTFAKPKVIDAINGMTGKVEAGFDKLSVGIPKAIELISPYWNVLKTDAKEVGTAFGEAAGAIIDEVQELTGAFGKKESVDNFSESMGTATGALTTFADFLKDHDKEVAKAITLLPKLYAAYRGFKIVKAVTPFVGMFTGAVGGLAKAGLGKIAPGLFKVSKGQEVVGKSSGSSSKKMVASAKAFMMMGVGVLSVGAGFYLLSQSAVAVANAGPGAIVIFAGLTGVVTGLAVGMTKMLSSMSGGTKKLTAMAPALLALGAGVLMVSTGLAVLAYSAVQIAQAGPLAAGVLIGMTVAVAGLMVVAKNVAPAMTAGATGFIAFGAAVLIAAAGIAILSLAAVNLANAGPLAIGCMVGMVAAIAGLALGAAALGPALTAGAVGLVAFGVAILLVSTGALLASVGLAIVAGVLPTIVQYGIQGAACIATLGAGMIVFGAGAAVAGAGCIVLGAGLVVVGAGLTVVGAAVLIAAAGVLLLAAGALALGAGLTVAGAGLLLMGAAFPAVSSGALVTVGALTALTALSLGLAAGMGASAVVVVAFGAAMAGGAVGTLAMVVALKSVNSSMKSIAGNAKSAQSSLTSMRSSVNVVNTGLDALGSKAKSAINALISQFTNAEGKARSSGNAVGNNFNNGVRNGMNRAVSTARSMSASTVSAMRSAGSGSYSCGVYIGAGLANGMASQVGRVRSVAAQLAAAAEAAIRAKAQIHSPSKVADKLGGYFGEGWVNGISDRVTDAKKAAWKLVDIPDLVPVPEIGAGLRIGIEDLNDDYDYTRNETYTIYVPVEVDGRQVAKATAKYTKEEIEQQQKRDLRKKGMR